LGGELAESDVAVLRGLPKERERGRGVTALLGHDDAQGLVDDRAGLEGVAQVLGDLLDMTRLDTRCPDVSAPAAGERVGGVTAPVPVAGSRTDTVIRSRTHAGLWR
jgi:hypothetical protein